VRELEQRSHEITLLNNMGDLIEACRTTEEAYAVIGQVAPQLFPSESGALYILRASHTFLEAVALWGPLPVQQVCGLHECWSLRRRRRHLSYSDQPELVCLHLPDPLPESALCYPMIWQGEMLGIFHLCREVGSLTEATQQLANTTTKSLSLALANIRLREMLHHQTIRDPLTGLHNRRYLDAALPRELQRADRHGHAVAVVMLDMDYFKRFNDSFGHDAGDKLLWEMGNLLRTHTRGEDIACRYGGEEFVLIIPGVSLSAGIQRMEQLRASVQQLTITYQGQSLGTVTLSLGVAVYPDHGITAEELLRAADAALYKAKADGRNRVVVA
jgi:diguanylate cyclase (GGDEF)-like protein